MTLIILAIYLFFVPKIANAQVSISEISPITDPEWVELYNASDSAVMLTGWKLITEKTAENIPDNTEIGPKSYRHIETSRFLSNTEPRTVELFQSVTQIDKALPYPAKISDNLSWSKQSSSWCQATPSKNTTNNICFVPTNTPVPTSTSTPVPSNTPPPTNTPTATLAPSNTNTPAPTSEPIHITIDNIPSSASLGSTFLIRFIVNHANSNTDYYVKAYGGINDNYYLEVQNGTSWYNFNSAWDNMPKFKSDSSGNINQLLFVRAKADKEPGNYKVKVKLKDPETESEIKYISITKFVPSPTPTKVEPTPTTEIIPTPEPLPTDSPETTPESANILGLAEGESLSTNITPIKNSKPSGNIVPVILISVGGVLLLVPLVVSKIRDAKEK